MDLKINLLRCNMKNTGNYYLVSQIDELEYPDKVLKSYKKRSDIVISSSNPKFLKCIFEYNNLSFGSRITLKLAIFDTSIIEENVDS